MLEELPIYKNGVVEPDDHGTGLKEGGEDNKMLEDTTMHGMIEDGNRNCDEMVVDEPDDGGGIIQTKGTILHYFPNYKSKGNTMTPLGMDRMEGAGRMKTSGTSNSLLRKTRMRMIKKRSK